MGIPFLQTAKPTTFPVASTIFFISDYLCTTKIDHVIVHKTIFKFLNANKGSKQSASLPFLSIYYGFINDLQNRSLECASLLVSYSPE